jgi:antitoxin (DNA-binding transcriptional repressor) of toxin-antitoxin stability system
MSATRVAREFSAVVNRIGEGEEIEVHRNGVPVVHMSPASAGHLVSADWWRELINSAPSPDEAFADDVEAGRRSVGPPSGAWLS